MKGLTHFMSGVALASFFTPAVLMAGKSGSSATAAASFILTLGGLYGIMPDTLDFKFGQFFSEPDVEVDCDPSNPDPQKMADQLGKAIDECWETGKDMKVQFYPMRLASNVWRQYVIKFDGNTDEVFIVLNEAVSTSQIPFMGTEPEKRVGSCKVKANLLETHGRPSVVDILSGPQFGFKKDGEHLLIEFLPWHRTWSHSYVLGAILALPTLFLALLMGFPNPWLYPVIAFLGFAIHLTEDLTGHMGGSLLWPIKKERCNGAGWFRASNPHMNFLIDYTCVSVIIYNLWRIMPPMHRVGKSTEVLSALPWYQYYFLFLAIPVTIYLLIVKFSDKLDDPKSQGAVNAEKLVEEFKVNEGTSEVIEKLSETDAQLAEELEIRNKETRFGMDQIDGM